MYSIDEDEEDFYTPEMPEPEVVKHKINIMEYIMRFNSSPMLELRLESLKHYEEMHQEILQASKQLKAEFGTENTLIIKSFYTKLRQLRLHFANSRPKTAFQIQTILNLLEKWGF